ncbi:hypothetical protein CC117_05215 [Parafrankia colletiae]|uniref:DUF3618 domain-containing protein n=1 Tax=Parafrankia colletiae TaxID=573497 RepID=A0A1S1QL05_9ACTN|nr:DUF3618 domain-containing protein [Parafrankia colletiae]MCK9900072.1 DUF3618 domain-containing protein [Frankia sp. Cpl3]OHV33772.1 hypothetical protein CC117_05215 [Parafrankia colletiae]
MPQDPAVIQRQIEQTRAELAETIDAITEIVSPRRVAERAGEQLRSKVAELRARFVPDGSADGPAGGVLGAGSAIRHAIAAVPSGAHRGSAGDGAGIPVAADGGPPLGPVEYGDGATEIVRTIRWERVALVSGAFVLVMGARRRRRRRR